MKICKYLILLLSVFLSGIIQAQSKLKVRGSSDYYPFYGINDFIFIKGKKYMMGMSPLSVFKDYQPIYYMNDELKFSISFDGPVSYDKYYDLHWAIAPDSMLYLCETYIWFEDEFAEKARMNFSKYIDLQTSINLPADKFLLYQLNPAKYMRHIPIEQLTGQKFRPSPYFPKILDIPINENGVLPAVWYSDTLYVKEVENALEDQDGPYQQLIIKNGRVIKVNKIVPIILPWPKRREPQYDENL